jgi:hypothetical protein
MSDDVAFFLTRSARVCFSQLEAVVSRLKLLSRLPSLRGSALASLRFVAVSATIPNVADVGAWIGAPPGHAPSFGDEYRACALEVKGASRTLRAEGNLCGMCTEHDDDALCDAMPLPSFLPCACFGVRSAWV